MRLDASWADNRQNRLRATRNRAKSIEKATLIRFKNTKAREEASETKRTIEIDRCTRADPDEEGDNYSLYSESTGVATKSTNGFCGRYADISLSFGSSQVSGYTH